MIITISGQIGSGKSTLATLIAEKLGWEYFGMGKIRRHAAEASGMTLAEFNKLGETNRSTDDLVDNFQIDLAELRDNLVVEGRLSWFFIPHSIKIFLTVDPQVAARRQYEESQAGGRASEIDSTSNLQEILRQNEARLASDVTRYQNYYHINPYDTKYYDFVLDTSSLSIQETFDQVWKYLETKITI